MGWHQQAGFPILSVITYLPLVGVLLIAAFGKGRPLFYKVVSLVVTLAAFVLSTRHAAALPHPPARHAVHRERHVDQALQHPLQLRHRRHLRAAHLPDDAARLHRHHLELALRQRPRARLLRLAAAPAGRHDRRVLRHRPVPVLRVLGGHAHPDVLHHRDLGRAPKDLRRHQVLPVHARRQRAHAGRHHRPGLLRPRQLAGRPDLQHPGAVASGAALQPAALGLRRLLPGLRHQGADVAVPHLAARRPRRGAHGGLGHPRRRAAQDGRLRHAAPLPADLSRRGRGLHPARRRPLDRGHHLRRPGLACSRRT